MKNINDILKNEYKTFTYNDYPPIPKGKTLTQDEIRQRILNAYVQDIDEDQKVDFIFFPDFCGLRLIEPTQVKDINCPRCNNHTPMKLIDVNLPKKIGIFCWTCTANAKYWHPNNRYKVCPQCYSDKYYKSTDTTGYAYLNCTSCKAVIKDIEPWHGIETCIIDDWAHYNNEHIEKNQRSGYYNILNKNGFRTLYPPKKLPKESHPDDLKKK